MFLLESSFTCIDDEDDEDDDEEEDDDLPLS